MRLNPFGSGTFFIHMKIVNLTQHQGLNPFGSGTFFIRKFTTLMIPLPRLNPFGSGTFFILGKEEEELEVIES